MLLTLAGRHVCVSKQLLTFSSEFQCGLADLANTQIPTNFSVEFPKKSVRVRLPLTPHQVFPSLMQLPLLGPTVTQLHILVSFCFSFVVCLLQPSLLHITGANPVSWTPKVIVYGVKPSLSIFMTRLVRRP